MELRRNIGGIILLVGIIVLPMLSCTVNFNTFFVGIQHWFHGLNILLYVLTNVLDLPVIELAVYLVC